MAALLRSAGPERVDCSKNRPLTGAGADGRLYAVSGSPPLTLERPWQRPGKRRVYASEFGECTSYSDLSSRAPINSNPNIRLPALTETPFLFGNRPAVSAPTPQ